MSVNNVWVFAQIANGAPTSATLELLTKARSLASNVAVFIGDDASSVAAALGEYGATKVYSTGNLGGKLPGVAVASAMKAVIDGGDKPDLVLFPQNYEGRDVMSRLSVKLDKTVLTNSIDVSVDGGAVSPARHRPQDGHALGHAVGIDGVHPLAEQAEDATHRTVDDQFWVGDRMLRHVRPRVRYPAARRFGPALRVRLSSGRCTHRIGGTNEPPDHPRAMDLARQHPPRTPGGRR